MSSAARSKKEQSPLIDPALQSKLTAKFGSRLMRRGFTAIPRLVQEHYRHVPGNVLKVREEINIFTGEVEEVYAVSYMTPTEYTIMTAIWSFWWTAPNDPWPSVESLCHQLHKSERTVRRYLQRLRDKGFMLSLEQYNVEGKQISNRYDFSPFFRRLLAYLDAMERPEQPAQASTKDARSDGERMPDLTGRGCQNRQGIEIESDLEPPNVENSDSSGEAASQKGTVLSPSSAYSHIERGAIRSAEEDTKESNEIESHRRSNHTPPGKEMPGAERVKEVSEVADDKKLTPFERTAMRAGVKLELVREMQEWLAACPKPQRHPGFVEGMIETFSLQMHNIPYLASNLTQATKIYRYAQSKGYTENDFRIMLFDAEKRCRWEGVSNPMAYFFVTLKVELLRWLTDSPLPLQAPPPSENHAAETEDTSNQASQGVSAPPASEEQSAAHHYACGSRELRAPEQREAREHYAKKVRQQLRQHGVVGAIEMVIDHEHSCGCPLYHDDWKCAHCHPNVRWEQDVLAFIDTILEH